MAEAFNQAPQFQQGYPYFWSRPTQEPKPDLSGKIAAEGIAKGIDTGAKVFGESISDLDKAESRGIMNETYRRGDELMNRDLAGLYAEYQGMSSDKPQEIKDLPQTIGTYSDARANGKISNTDHDARIDSLAKELRAKYPGYRNEVDEYIRAATGRGSTANQLWTSLREDIDTQIATRNARSNKIESELFSMAKEGIPGAGVTMQLAKVGKMDEVAVAKWMENAMSFKYKEMRDNAEKASMEKDKVHDEVISKKVEQDATYRFAHIYQGKMDHIEYAIAGNDPMTMTQITEGIARGTLNISPAQSQQIKLMMNAIKAQAIQEFNSQINTPVQNIAGADASKTDAQYLGDAKIKQIIEDGSIPWDTYSNLISDEKNLSMASAAKFIYQANQEEAARGLQQNPVLGRAVTTMGALTKSLGSQVASTLVGPLMGDPKITAEARKVILGDGVSQFTLPPDPKSGYKGTLATAVQKLQDVQASPEAYQYLLNTVDLISNTKVPIESRKEIAESAYGINNQGIIQKFSDKENKYGGNDQHDVFNSLTSDKKVKELHAKIGADYPQVWDHFVNWSENEWQGMTLKDIATLRENYEKIQSATIPRPTRFHRDTTPTEPKFSFGYDFDKHHIVIKPTDPDAFKHSGRAVLLQTQALQRNLDRINSATDRMRNIYEAEGKEDVDFKLGQLLMSAGTPDKVIANSILDAIKLGVNRPYGNNVQ